MMVVHSSYISMLYYFFIFFTFLGFCVFCILLGLDSFKWFFKM